MAPSAPMTKLLQPAKRGWLTWASEKDFLEAALYVAGILALVAVGFSAIKLGDLASSAQQDMTRMTQQVNRLVIITAGTATNVEKATRSINEKETAEYAQIQAVSGKLNDVAYSANESILMLKDTLVSVNNLVKNTDSNMNALSKDADNSIKDLHPVLVNLNGSLASLKVELDALPETTKNLNASLVDLPPVMEQAKVVMANTARITGDAADLSDHYKKVVLAPVTKVKAAWNIFSRAMENIIGAAIGVKI